LTIYHNHICLIESELKISGETRYGLVENMKFEKCYTGNYNI